MNALTNSEITAITTPKYTWFLKYTTTDGQVIPTPSGSFGANLISNTYYTDYGVLQFDAPITTIPKKAFYDCETLSGVYIPSTVSSIQKDAFTYCTALTDLTIESGLKTICVNSFGFCTGLTSVTIPSSVTDIQDFAFQWCENVSFDIQGTPTVGAFAFYRCVSWTNIVITKTVDDEQIVDETALCGCYYTTAVVDGSSYSDSVLCRARKCDTIEDNAYVIDSTLVYAKHGTVIIPLDVDTINDNAFDSQLKYSSISYKGTSYSSKTAFDTALEDDDADIVDDQSNSKSTVVVDWEDDE